jgi:hypothetical protein
MLFLIKCIRYILPIKRKLRKECLTSLFQLATKRHNGNYLVHNSTRDISFFQSQLDLLQESTAEWLGYRTQKKNLTDNLQLAIISTLQPYISFIPINILLYYSLELLHRRTSFRMKQSKTKGQNLFPLILRIYTVQVGLVTNYTDLYSRTINEGFRKKQFQSLATVYTDNLSIVSCFYMYRRMK